MVGKRRSMVVPRPGAVSMAMVPLCSSITCRTMASPRPVPLPRSLVVKKGSKMWGSTSGEMPEPVSETWKQRNSPSGRVATVRVPPPGSMAW